MPLPGKPMKPAGGKRRKPPPGQRPWPISWRKCPKRTCPVSSYNPKPFEVIWSRFVTETKPFWPDTTNNQRAWEALTGLEKERQEVQQQWVWVRALSHTANGAVPGKDKVTLETYVQMTWFDRILARANVRLMAMTGGRYELIRRRQARTSAPAAGWSWMWWTITRGDSAV